MTRRTRKLLMGAGKVLAILAMTALMIAIACGCNGVVMSPEYSQLLDRTAALTHETATRATAGQLSGPEMVQALQGDAILWARFKAAKDGVRK